MRRGALQWRFAENTAMGPRERNRSSTRCCAKSGGVNASWNLEEAVGISVVISN